MTESPLFAKQTTGSFEMHRSADGAAYLITYVAPEDRRRIEFGEGEVALKLYPAAHGDATEVVALETSRLTAKKRNPSRQGGNWFAVTLRRS